MIKLTNSQYDKAKALVLTWLPALGALYFGLGQIWGFPAIEQVLGSLAVVGTFLGTVLNLNAKKYYEGGGDLNGDIMIVDDAGTRTTVVAFNEDPVGLKAGDRVTLQVLDLGDK